MPELRPALLVTASGVLALLPALTWLASAGPQALGWWGLASLTGLAAAGLLAVCMLLALRLTWLDRAFGGLARVQRTHRALGVAGFVLMLVHPLALGLATFPSLRALSPRSWAGGLGWAALGLFAVLLVLAVLPRLSYDTWRRAHQALGLAYAAMAGHLAAVWTGSVPAGLALGLVVAGALAYGYRLLALDSPRQGLPYRVVEVRHRGPEVVDLALEPLAAPLRFEAGQFVYLAVVSSPDYQPCGELHPYTMTGHPDDPRLRLSIKALGGCTRHLQEIAPGAEVRIQGPFGGLFPARLQRPQVWIGGGMGISPFRSRAASLGPDDPPVDLVYAAPSREGAVYLDELRQLAEAHPNLRLHTVLQDSDGLPTGSRIRSEVGALQAREIVLAGPPAMVTALRPQLRALGATRIRSEEPISGSGARPFVLAGVGLFSLASGALAMVAQQERPAVEPMDRVAAGPSDEQVAEPAPSGAPRALVPGDQGTQPAPSGAPRDLVPGDQATDERPAGRASADQGTEGPAEQRAAGSEPAPVRAFTAAEVARHDQPDDCWLAIRGKVYDVTRYIPSHPTSPATITEHCGRDATTAFETKDRGRPHSSYAWDALEDYRVGDLAR